MMYQAESVVFKNDFNHLNFKVLNADRPTNDLLLEKNTSKVVFKKSRFLVNKKITIKILNIFLFLNHPVKSANSVQTAFFNFFYFKEKNKIVQSVNIKKVLLRWELTSSLFLNLFWYESNPLLFSSPFFKKETISFNWATHNWEQIIWRYYFLFFNFKSNQNTDKFNFFCLKIQDLKINFFLITDTEYHFKNLHFFRRFLFYTVGLTPFNVSPWIVNFPIPAADNHYLMQLFLFKYVMFIKKNAFKQKYTFFKKIALFAL